MRACPAAKFCRWRAGAGALSFAGPLARPALAQAKPIKIGLLLPYSGTFAQLGEAITRAMELYVKQQGGMLAGRPITFVKLDDESEPPKAPDLTTKLVQGEKVDVLMGSVHSGVAMAMSKIAREEGIPTIIPNAGADILTRAQCAKNIFRSSFSNGQVGLAAGKAMADAGIKKVVTITWKYAAGDETLTGFQDTFTKGGGQVAQGDHAAVPECRVPVGAGRDRLAQAGRGLSPSSPAAAR